jgi:hypothetical protein
MTFWNSNVITGGGSKKIGMNGGGKEMMGGEKDRHEGVLDDRLTEKGCSEVMFTSPVILSCLNS